MDKGNIIYLVIVAIFIISSIIKKINKKTQTEDTVEQNPSPASAEPWRELMRELTGFETENPVSEARAEPTMDNTWQNSKPEPVIELKETCKPLETKAETSPSKTDAYKHTESNLQQSKTTNTEKIQFNAQEIRKAIIYNEILKRKYC